MEIKEALSILKEENPTMHELLKANVTFSHAGFKALASKAYREAMKISKES
jgi:hypothetical protein